MLIWGSGHKTVQKSVTDSLVCTGCSRANNFSVVVDYDYSHLYWLFKWVKNIKTSLACENCGNRQDADDQREGDLFEKLGGNPIPFMDRFGGAVLLLIVAGGIAFAFLSQASRDGSGAIVSSGRIDAFDIRLGDCFNDESPESAAEETEISGVSGVPCAEPHDNEVFALFDLDLETFPEGDAMSEIAYDECVQRFEPFVGSDYLTSSLDLYPMYPTQQSWNERNDREVICALFDVDLRKMQGSMRGAGI